MNGISFNRANGGLGRRLPGDDHVSGLIAGGTPTVAGKWEFRNVEEAEAAGITAEALPVVHYHIAEFFRVAPGAKLFVLLTSAALDGTFTEIKTLQAYAGGALKQVAVVMNTTALAEAIPQLGTIETICGELQAQNIPLIVVIQPALTAADLASLPDLHSQNAPHVSVCIAADGGGYGKYLKTSQNVTVGAIGALLGTIAKSGVGNSIGWVEKYNVVTAAYPKGLTGGEQGQRELDEPALNDGTLIRDLTPAQLEALNEKGYIFLTKYVGASGTYWNDSFSAVALTSDYAYIENNRVWNKAARGVYAALLPKVSGPAQVDPETGYLLADVKEALEALAGMPLDQMERDVEISGYVVSINPEQNILATSQLLVTVKIVPVGVMREIVGTIGFAVAI